MSHSELTEYIKSWIEVEGVKPNNDPIFINGFIEFINSIDDERDVDFDGDGSYFGKQITIGYGKGCWKADTYLHFEVAYDNNQITIYTAKHHGFWTPVYASVVRGNPTFIELQAALYGLLQKVFGVPIMIRSPQT